MKILLTLSQTGLLLQWAATYETLNWPKAETKPLYLTRSGTSVSTMPLHIPVQGPGKTRQRECEGQKMGRLTVAQVFYSLTTTASENSLSTNSTCAKFQQA